jgi:hypothetical protein
MVTTTNDVDVLKCLTPVLNAENRLRTTRAGETLAQSLQQESATEVELASVDEALITVPIDRPWEPVNIRKGSCTLCP